MGSPFTSEPAMPLYKVWYQNKAEPLEFSTAAICREDEIVRRVLAHEGLIPFVVPDANRGAPGAKEPTVRELIAQNHLAPIRYTEDESEALTIA